MTFYRQRHDTDCLLTCLETMLQQPREEMGSLWEAYLGGYLSYRAALRIMKQPFMPYLFMKHSTINPYLWWSSAPQTIGVQWFDEDTNRGAIHAVILEDQRIWEPFRGEWHDLSYLNHKAGKIVYVIAQWAMHSLYCSVDYTDDLLTRWDAGIDDRIRSGSHLGVYAKADHDQTRGMVLADWRPWFQIPEPTPHIS